MYFLQWKLYLDSNFKYTTHFIILPPIQRSCWGGTLVSLRPSVRPSRIPCPLCIIYTSGWILSIFGTNDQGLENRVRSVASTVLNGFFPYLVQMITSMRRWPWPISSRSFDLGLENRVRSVASTVQNGFFPYLVQMITTMRRCVACDDLWPWPISSRSFDLDFENRVRSVTLSGLDRLFPYLPQIITTIRGCVAC